MILTALLLAVAQPATPAPSIPHTPAPRLHTAPSDPAEPPAALGEAWMRCYSANATRLVRASTDTEAAVDEAGRACRADRQALIAWATARESQTTSREALRNLAFLFFYKRALVVADAEMIRNPLPDAADMLSAEPGR